MGGALFVEGSSGDPGLALPHRSQLALAAGRELLSQGHTRGSRAEGLWHRVGAGQVHGSQACCSHCAQRATGRAEATTVQRVFLDAAKVTGVEWVTGRTRVMAV